LQGRTLRCDGKVARRDGRAMMAKQQGEMVAARRDGSGTRPSNKQGRTTRCNGKVARCKKPNVNNKTTRHE